MINNGTKTVSERRGIVSPEYSVKGSEKKPQRLKLSWTQVLTAFVLDEDGPWRTVRELESSLDRYSTTGF
jgi:hypothetical protein